MSDEKWTARIAELEDELARSEAERSICVEDTIKMSHELEAERTAREAAETNIKLAHSWNDQWQQRAEAAEASLAAERKELEEAEVLGKYYGVAGRRWWWSGGAWLYPGQKVVVIDAAKGSKSDDRTSTD